MSTTDRPDPTRRAAIVVNPSKVNVTRLRAAVVAEEQRQGWAESLWLTTSPDDDGRQAARDAAAAHPDVILVAGGDGTLRIAAETLHESGIPIALVPAGTGNLYARNLRLPVNSIPLSVRTAFTGNDRRVDVGFAELLRPDGSTERHAFMVMAGVGLDARMAGHTNARLKKRLGWVAYSDPIARSVFGNRQIDIDYALDDDTTRSMRAHTVIVGNCGTLTAGILLLPDAVVDDGTLNAVAFRPQGGAGWTTIGSSLAFNRLMHRTVFGRMLGLVVPTARTLRYREAKRLRFDFATPEEIQLDGDPFGAVAAVTLTVAHRALVLRVA